MPSLIDLRRRIRAVKNTQQITKAMKMVAASKLRRAQERIVAARPYAAQMKRVLTSVAARVDPSIHPLLAARVRSADQPRATTSALGSSAGEGEAALSQPGSKAGSGGGAPRPVTLVIVVTGDKGLCGSFNTNIIKAAGGLLVSESEPTTLGLVGRKGRDFFARRGFPIFFEHVGFFHQLRFEDARVVAKAAIEAFLSESVDRVVLVYNEFKSVISQRVVVDQLLPIPREEVSAGAASGAADTTGGIDYLYEPAPQEIFNQLLPRYVEVQVFRALLESNAAFFAAQMTAMDTATKNSADMIASLTLYMNKVRQAAITREIIEVVSGAEAL